MNIRTPIAQAIHTTADYIAALKNMQIETVEDALLYLPRAHEDLSAMLTLQTAPLETKVSIRGTIQNIRIVFTRSRMKIIEADFTDTTGDSAQAIWFNQPHIKRMLQDGEEIVLVGKLVKKGRKLQFMSPLIEKNRGTELLHTGRIVPIYPEHDIINTKWFREKIAHIRTYIAHIPENLPEDVIVKEGIVSRSAAIEMLHFPSSGEDVKKAKERKQFEDMYLYQIAILQQKNEWQGVAQSRLEIPMDIDLIRAFFESLHFKPTDGQRIAIYEILRDMHSTYPMSRLLEGDVGSGKTMVATAVMANVIRHNGQCALMVPTEVLARQHVQSIGTTLINFYTYIQQEISKGRGNTLPNIKHPSIALLTGSMTKKEADDVRVKLANGSIDLVIGTHALIQDSVLFKNLSLVIVDEQHRFGVEQRATLKNKGNPHFLAMTATPIPRTLALTAHGDHDLSVLVEKPGNRQPVFTKVVTPNDRKTVELFIDVQIEEGRQVFVICPLITESESEEMAEVKSVENEAKRLAQSFPRRTIAILHGKMNADEKESIMQTFKANRSHILVSTSVIEVGVDVPNATIIVIEGAERFGLAQLHQFRGRVGRGQYKSYCYLCTTNKNQAYSKRLQALEEHDSGFKLAEIDLQIRGPGDLQGTRQSGLPAFDSESLMNPELIVRARRAAEETLFGNATPMM